MNLHLMYITNNLEIAKIAEASGVDRIFVDLEYIGKEKRQGGMDTVQSHHSIEDISKVKSVLKTSELIVRCNPIHNASYNYCDSKTEINQIIDAGADIIMLPYFKTVFEVSKFLYLVDGRAKTMLLLETPEAVEVLDKILQLPGIDYIHIGINDLSLGYHKKFMFELLMDGTISKICKKIKKAGIPYGFGGIAGLGKGDLPSEHVIMEHYRLGSTCAILSRSFCNTDAITDLNKVNETFVKGVKEIRDFENSFDKSFISYQSNKRKTRKIVKSIVKNK